MTVVVGLSHVWKFCRISWKTSYFLPRFQCNFYEFSICHHCFRVGNIIVDDDKIIVLSKKKIKLYLNFVRILYFERWEHWKFKKHFLIIEGTDVSVTVP